MKPSMLRCVKCGSDDLTITADLYVSFSSHLMGHITKSSLAKSKNNVTIHGTNNETMLIQCNQCGESRRGAMMLRDFR